MHVVKEQPKALSSTKNHLNSQLTVFFIKNVTCYGVIMNSRERSESTNAGIRFKYMDKRGKFYLYDYCKKPETKE